MVKNPPANAGDSGKVGLIPWRGKWQPTPVFLPGKFHGQRSFIEYSPWDRKESDTPEQLTFSLSFFSKMLFLWVSDLAQHFLVK